MFRPDPITGCRLEALSFGLGRSCFPSLWGVLSPLRACPTVWLDSLTHPRFRLALHPARWWFECARPVLGAGFLAFRLSSIPCGHGYTFDPVGSPVSLFGALGVVFQGSRRSYPLRGWTRSGESCPPRRVSHPPPSLPSLSPSGWVGGFYPPHILSIATPPKSTTPHGQKVHTHPCVSTCAASPRRRRSGVSLWG